MSSRWTLVRPVEAGEAALVNLLALGIELRPARGLAPYENDPEDGLVKKIGTIGVWASGRITCVPHTDNTSLEVRMLLGIALEVFRGERSTKDWRTITRAGERRRVNGWWVLAEADDPVSLKLARRQPLHFLHEAERHVHFELEADERHTRA